MFSGTMVLWLLTWQLSQPLHEPHYQPLEPYLDIITRYREGHLESATKELAAWPAAHVQYIIELLRATKDDYETLDVINPSSVRTSFPEWLRNLLQDATIQAAVMLHTDVAFRTGGRPLDDSGEVHLGIAQRLSEMIEEEGHRQSFQRDWLLTIGYYFQSMLASLRAIEYFEDALDLVPEDGEILLALGTAHETLGRRFRGGVQRSDETSRFEREAQIRQRNHLRKTRSFFERALKVDPAPLEARLRLGRLQHRLGNDKEALQQLHKCSSGASEPSLKFLSHLFLGEVFESQGKMDKAIEAYRDAHQTDSDSHAGSLALSHALHTQGERRTAFEIWMSALSKARPDDDDPWWRYPFGRSEQFESMLNRMRKDVLFD